MSARIKIRQTILVEGKYDQIKLQSVFDANILATGGFAIFKDPQKLNMLRRIAQKDGLIILTDSDAAGFKIRSFIGGALPKEQVTHIYIPDIAGKEKRKTAPSAEGKLGVEGMQAAALIEAFTKAGVLPQNQEAMPAQSDPVTRADLYEWGLTGGKDSHARRIALAHKLNLPARLSTSALLTVLGRLYTRSECAALVQTLDTAAKP